MKTLKFLFVIALIVTATNSYASWSHSISINGNGLTGRTSDYRPGRAYLAGQYNFTAQLNVRVQWQKNLFLFTLGDGLADSQVTLYNNGTVTGTKYISQEGLGNNGATISGFGNQYDIWLHVWALGWRTSSASITFNY